MEHVILSQLRAAEMGVALLGQLAEGLDQAKPENRLAPHVAASTGSAIVAAIALLESWANGPVGDQEPAPAAEPDDGICRHPEDRRRKTATMTKPHAWMCLACGFQHEGETING